MVLAAFNLSLLEIIILQLGAIILGITIYFFWVSHKSLSETIRNSKKQLDLAPKKKIWDRVVLKHDMLDDLEHQLTSFKTKSTAGSKVRQSPTLEKGEAHAITALKDLAMRQQQTLNTLLGKIEGIEGKAGNSRVLTEENSELKKQLEKKELQLETKESEIKQLKQQEAVAQQMGLRIEEVYKEFELLQAKISSLEKSANRANSLTLELEDARQSIDQLQKDLLRKQEKLEETIAENQRLHASLSITEDKLAEANLQRQQLQKKTQFLQDMNSDMQHMSESNTKLQNELRRIGELESMLSMISEERDRLMNKGDK